MRLDSPYTPSETLADYLQHYGLASDPFTDDPEFPFFGGGQRRQLLEQLLHLCQFSASLLAVLGEPGVGKTRMAHALIQAFSAEQDLCHLDAQAECTAEQILGDIAQSFGIAGTEPQTQGQLLASLRRFGQSADDLDSLALIVIDNAHHLDEQTLGGLLSLLQGQDVGGRRLHIVLFALPALANRLDSYGMHDVLVHDFYIDPLPLLEASDYLNFRMEMADYLGPELFSESLVEPWWRRAEGDVKQLHRHAHQWLLESVVPAAPAERRGLPLVHIIAVSLLLGILMMALLYRGSSSPPEPEPLVLEPRPRVESTRQPVPVQAAPEPAPQEPIPEPESAPPDVLDMPIEPTIVSPPPEPAEPPQPALPRQAERPPQPAAPAPAPAPREVPTASVPPQLPEDEQVLLSWRASEYTLQLLGAGSEKAVQDFMARQPNRAQLLTFKSQRQGKDWYVVVTGRYPSSEAARAAVADLPAAQRQAGPWARPLSGIQEEIEGVRGLN